MGDIVLHTHDQLYGSYAQISANVGDSTSKSAVDGDPATVWSVAATAAALTANIGGSYTCKGFGFANHNVAGATVIFKKYVAGFTNVISVTAPAGDFIVIVTGGASGTQWQWSISGAPNPFHVGEISLLTDYGYNRSGVLTLNSGYSSLAFGSAIGAVEGGAQYPISRSCDPGVRRVGSAGGFSQRQLVAGQVMAMEIPIKAMLSGADQRWDKAFRSFYPDMPDDAYTNRGWAKPCWLQLDEVVADTPCAALYCVAAPDFDLGHAINGPGGLANGALRLITLAH